MKPLRGRSGRKSTAASLRPASHLTELRHAVTAARGASRLLRRGPQSMERSGAPDLGFTVASGGVILAAALLGIALGLASPSWMLAAALVAGGVVLAAITALALKAGGGHSAAIAASSTIP